MALSPCGGLPFNCEEAWKGTIGSQGIRATNGGVSSNSFRPKLRLMIFGKALSLIALPPQSPVPSRCCSSTLTSAFKNKQSCIGRSFRSSTTLQKSLAVAFPYLRLRSPSPDRQTPISVRMRPVRSTPCIWAIISRRYGSMSGELASSWAPGSWWRRLIGIRSMRSSSGMAVAPGWG